MLEGMLKPIGGKKRNHTENPEYQNQASCRHYPFWSKISVLFKFTLQQPTLQHPVTAIPNDFPHVYQYLEPPRPLTCKASQQYPSCAWTHLKGKNLGVLLGKLTQNYYA